MFRFSCCPTLKLTSFMTLITIFDIIMFIVVIAIGGTSRGDASAKIYKNFLTPNMYYLWLFGDKDAWYMKGVGGFPQIWRFLTPVYLHGGFAHLLSNCVSQLIFGSMIEAIAGFKKTVLIYVVGAIGGNLLGALTSDNVSVGASTAIAALLGAGIGWLILNWKNLESQSDMRCMITCWFSVIIIMNILFGFGAGSSTTTATSGAPKTLIDWYGHLGGFYTGIFIGMAAMTASFNRNVEYEKKVRKLGLGLLIFWFVLGFTLFYTVRKPVFQPHPNM